MKEVERRPEPSAVRLRAALDHYQAFARAEGRMNREGFYRPIAAKHSELPVPVAREHAWKGEREFLEKLAVLEGRRHVTRIEVSDKTECHFCDAQLWMTEHWVLGQWKWTSALFHYVKAHHVRPSVGFQEFVIQRGLK